MLSHKSGVFVIDMAAEGFVQFKEPRIISEVHKPVHDSLDVVYSKKFGYVLLGLPAADSIDDSDVTRLEDPETLVKEIYQNLAYDFMEQEGHSEDYTEATNLEKRATREWMKGYTDQLPEYNYLLDELLG